MGTARNKTREFRLQVTATASKGDSCAIFLMDFQLVEDLYLHTCPDWRQHGRTSHCLHLLGHQCRWISYTIGSGRHAFGLLPGRMEQCIPKIKGCLTSRNPDSRSWILRCARLSSACCHPNYGTSLRPNSAKRSCKYLLANNSRFNAGEVCSLT